MNFSSSLRVQQWASEFSVQLRELTVKYSGSLLLQKVSKVKIDENSVDLLQSRFICKERKAKIFAQLSSVSVISRVLDRN